MIYPNLEAEMARHGVTQEDIAALAEKRPETISNWMNGKAGEFPVGIAMKVAASYFPTCSVEYLVDRKDG